jgi:hypothetical protein
VPPLSQPFPRGISVISTLSHPEVRVQATRACKGSLECPPLNLRTGALMDRRPKPSDIPQELLDLIQVHWRWLCEQWDAKYPDNRVEGSEG